MLKLFIFTNIYKKYQFIFALTVSTISSSSLDNSGGGNGGTPGGSLLGANVGTDGDVAYALVFFKILGGIGIFTKG
jgi:hypothetical protein